MAKSKRKRLPPRRICPGCGREFRSYKRDCPWCLQDGGQENRSALAEMAKDARLARRGPDTDPVPGAAPVPYGELPDGF